MALELLEGLLRIGQPISAHEVESRDETVSDGAALQDRDEDIRERWRAGELDAAQPARDELREAQVRFFLRGWKKHRLGRVPLGQDQANKERDQGDDPDVDRNEPGATSDQCEHVRGIATAHLVACWMTRYTVATCAAVVSTSRTVPQTFRGGFAGTQTVSPAWIPPVSPGFICWPVRATVTRVFPLLARWVNPPAART